jgi:hypothetical protein
VQVYLWCNILKLLYFSYFLEFFLSGYNNTPTGKHPWNRVNHCLSDEHLHSAEQPLNPDDALEKYLSFPNDSIGNLSLFRKYFKTRSPIKHFGDDRKRIFSYCVIWVESIPLAVESGGMRPPLFLHTTQRHKALSIPFHSGQG